MIAIGRVTTFFSLLISIETTLSTNLSYPLPVTANKIQTINVTCDTYNLNATLVLEAPFKGLLFAKHFSQECRAIGMMSATVNINLSTSGCGVRLRSTKTDDNGSVLMVYSVVLVVQQDRHLQQIADQEKHLECRLGQDAFRVRSKPLNDFVKHSFRKERKSSTNDAHLRTSRMQNNDEVLSQLHLARAWMEIFPEKKDPTLKTDTLRVGESAVLTVKSTLPVGIGWKVTSCVAHDGLGDSSQKLLDEDGCPLDDLIPQPVLRPIRSIALMMHQEAVTKFAAFKFPDRDRLHLLCSLQLCRGNCSKVDCSQRASENRFSRTLNPNYDEDSEILDRLEVFNSIEVVAPDIDDFKNKEHLKYNDVNTYPFGNLPGDRTVCVSPSKMAITFCFLGLIFLCAVVVAACALFRSRLARSNGPFYNRSIFSSSSGSSAYDSKMFMTEGPHLGHLPQSARGIQYGRIF